MKTRFVFTFNNMADDTGLNERMLAFWKNRVTVTPSFLQIPGKKHYPFSVFDDKNLTAALKQKKDFILMDNNYDALFAFFVLGTHVNVTFSLTDDAKTGVPAFVDVFLEIVKSGSLVCARAAAEPFDTFLRNNNAVYNRTFLMPGLFWLNFFGPDEEKKQGGWQIEQNPYATRIERFPNGLFIQVGESPESCLTPEGEQRLLDATKAMPPVPPPDTSGHEVEITDPVDDKY